jgi:2-furoyl-CoA dehydrogenase 2Fe-2S iron sulfur subunit
MTTLRRAAGERATIGLILNGQRRTGQAEPRTLLSDFLRHELQAFGVHVGCEHGICGACTVLIDGRAVRSCTQYAVQAEGADIVTIEGLAEPGTMNALQRAFAEHHALQCGYCTPGILCSATQFLREVPAPDELQIRDMLTGHICRCTGYASIVSAILDAAARIDKGP